MQTKISKERIDAYINQIKIDEDASNDINYNIIVIKNHQIPNQKRKLESKSKSLSGTIDHLESLHEMRKSKYSQKIRALEKMRDN